MKRVRELGIIVFPIAAMAFGSMCWLILLITGRPLINDVGSLVDFGISSIKILTWATTTAAIQYCLIGFRTKACTSGDEACKPKMSDDIFDLVTTLVFMVLIGYGYANWF